MFSKMTFLVLKKTPLFFSDGRHLNKIMYPKTIVKVKIMVVPPLRVTSFYSYLWATLV